MVRNNQPQMTAVSNNICPNAGVRKPFTQWTPCDADALTTWGYCSYCWSNDLVPVQWYDAVERTIGQVIER